MPIVVWIASECSNANGNQADKQGETMNDYEKQANDFLEKTGTNLTVTCIRYGKHFRTDTENRFIYSFTLERNGRKYTSTFGESLAHAYELLLGKRAYTGKGITLYEEQILNSVKLDTEKQTITVKCGHESYKKITKPVPMPSAYSILSCLEKYEPSESVDDWAAEYGYELNRETKIQDIIDTHKACIEQYKGLCMLFNESEMDELREIS